MRSLVRYLVQHHELEVGFFNPKDEITRVFQGAHHDVESVSCILSETPPGLGAPSHTHPYPEVFVIHQGSGRFTVDGETVVATAGDIVIVPAGAPHEFINHTDELMRHVSMHASSTIQIEDTKVEEG